MLLCTQNASLQNLVGTVIFKKSIKNRIVPVLEHISESDNEHMLI